LVAEVATAVGDLGNCGEVGRAEVLTEIQGKVQREVFGDAVVAPEPELGELGGVGLAFGGGVAEEVNAGVGAAALEGPGDGGAVGVVDDVGADFFVAGDEGRMTVVGVHVVLDLFDGVAIDPTQPAVEGVGGAVFEAYGAKNVGHDPSCVLRPGCFLPGKNPPPQEAAWGADSSIICRMVVKVNGESRELPDGETVLALIARYQLTPEKVAIELNRRLLRGERYETALKEGDEVEIVTFVGGG